MLKAYSTQLYKFVVAAVFTITLVLINVAVQPEVAANDTVPATEISVAGGTAGSQGGNGGI